MQGRTSDPDRARELMASDPTDWAAYRPDILGTLLVGHDEGAWTMAIYFTSEADARAGEQKEPPPEMAKMMEEMAEPGRRGDDVLRPDRSLAGGPWLTWQRSSG